MDFNAKKKHIVDQLVARIRVAVENDGYQSDDPEAAFDSYEATGLLDKFADVEARADNAAREGDDRAGLVKPLRDQIDSIKASIDEYAKRLAKNAEIGKVSITSVESKVFDKQARVFERKHKKDLRLVSPDYFV